MRAAGVRADAVHVAPQIFVGRFGPAEDDFDAWSCPRPFRRRKPARGTGRFWRFGRQFFEISRRFRRGETNSTDSFLALVDET